jgi:hypothetical protein
MSITPYIILWTLLGLLVVGLALYRKPIALHEEDDLVHISEGEQRLIPRQVAINTKIEKIDRWGPHRHHRGLWLADRRRLSVERDRGQFPH